MNDKTIQQLREAAGRECQHIAAANRFKEIGFDNAKPRLGWVKPPAWEDIRRALKECEKHLAGKKDFIFTGIGGSINSIKTAASLKKSRIHCIDSLDAEAMKALVGSIKDFSTVAVIPISKSGTTKETQLIARAFASFFDNPKEHFLWLVDPDSSDKLDSCGWKGFTRLPIQVDGKSDIGGRFSAPHTLIFFLPVFLMLGKSYAQLEKRYKTYLAGEKRIVRQAFNDAKRLSRKSRAYFSVIVSSAVLANFRTWITQLFQESLGSKRKGLLVKTLVASRRERGPLFAPLSLRVKIKDPLVRMMSTMYYLQNFVALYAYAKRLNFVDQPSVEQYKQAMKTLHFEDAKSIEPIDFDGLMEIVAKKIAPRHKFIEVVLYFYPDGMFLRKVQDIFQRRFPGRIIFVFIGSDWNHHSYQAAYGDTETLYILLTRRNFSASCPPVPKECTDINHQTLTLISYATYLTLKSKAVLYAISP